MGHVGVVGKLLEAGKPENTVQTVLNKLEKRVEDYDVGQAWQAGVFIIAIKTLGLSIGDRASLALACVKNLPVLTTDKNWSESPVGLEVIQLR